MPRSTAATSPPGPSGAPARGRTDVLPTGRNLFTADPRTMPTPTAFELGSAAADEVLRRYVQDHGDWPRALVIDLWGSASLRTGGEEIAQGLALMGCRPQWDAGDRPRHRRRGAAAGGTRPAARRRHLAHLRPVPRHVPGPDRADRRRGRRGGGARRGRWRQPARRAAARTASRTPPRIFGSSPGTYGAGDRGACWRAATGRRGTRSAAPISMPPRTPMAAPTATARAAPGAFAERVADGRAARPYRRRSRPRHARRLGRRRLHRRLRGSASRRSAASADVIALDTTDPAAPAGALARRGGRAGRAGARRQSALHRRPDAARPARRGRIRRDRRPAGRLCRDDGRRVAGALIEAVHDAYLGDRRGARLHAAREPGRRACDRRALCRLRAGAASGIRCATPSTTISRR